MYRYKILHYILVFTMLEYQKYLNYSDLHRYIK
jgi:hypothetical protein